MDRLPKILSHISTVLSINTDAPVAILGSAMPESINVTVVQSMPLEFESHELPHRPFVVHTVTPSARGVGDVLVENGCAPSFRHQASH